MSDETPSKIQSADYQLSALFDEAPTGTMWVCGACGRYRMNRSKFGDESCHMRAVLCWTQSLKFSGDGKTVLSAKAYKP